MEESNRNLIDDKDYINSINKLNTNNFKYILILEIALSFSFIIISFLVYSYLNFFNLFIGLYLLIFLYQGCSIPLNQLKRIILLIAISLNSLEYIIRLIFLALIWLDYGGNTIINIGKYLIVYKDKVPLTIVGFVASFILICLLGVFYFIKKWDFIPKDASEYNKTIGDILFIKNLNKEFILSLGLFFICIGASIFPTTIGLCFISIAFIHFFAVATNQQLGFLIVNIISYIVNSIIPIYFFFNYLMNCEYLNSFCDYYPMALLGLVKLYTLKDDDTFYSYNVFRLIPFLFYLIGFFFIIVYREMKFRTTIEIADRLTGKSKFIIDFFKKTPSFSLHLCRIGIIVWVSANKKIYSVLFITWILLSTIFQKNKLFFQLTKYIMFPLLFIGFTTNFIGNINGITIDSSNTVLILFGVEKFTKESIAFLQLTLKIIVTSLFAFFIHMRISNETIEKDSKIEIKELEMETIDNNKEVSLLEKDNENDNEGNVEEEKEKEKDHHLESEKPMLILTYNDIFFRAFLYINDWLLIIFLFLGISDQYNLLNGVILLFLIAVIIEIKSLHKGYYLILILFNLSFLGRYICYFFYPKKEEITTENTTEAILSLIFYDYLSGSSYLWVAYYCLYIKYSSLKSSVYFLYHSNRLSMAVLIERKFNNFKRIKLVFHLLNSFISGLYIWALFPLIVLSLLLCKNNLLFFILLLMLFWIYYKYILLLGINFNQENSLLVSAKIFTIACIVITLLVYIWQILQAKIVLDLLVVFQNQDVILLMNLIGFFNFNLIEKVSFFPYIFIIVIAAALHKEIESQMKGNGYENEKNTRFYSKKLANVLYYLLHYYWILIFFVVTVFAIHWMLSVSMAIELLLFSYFIMKSFRGYYQCLNQKRNQSYSKFYQYKFEKKIHYKITSENQHNYINVVWASTFGFIAISYISCLILKFVSYESPNKADVILYVLGCYSYSMEALDFLLYSWGYFFIIALFSLRAYFLSKYFDLQNAKEMKRKKRKEDKVMKKKKKNNEDDNNKDIALTNKDAYTQSIIMSQDIHSIFVRNTTMKFGLKNKDNNKEDSISNYRRKSFDNTVFISNEIHLILNDLIIASSSSLENEDDYDYENEEEENNSISNKDINNLKANKISNAALNYPALKQSKDDTFIHSKPNKIASLASLSPAINYSFNFMRGVKKTVESIIIVLVLVSAIIKTNIISFLLVFCIILIYNKGLNVSIMFNFSLIILSLFIIQYLLFVSNISNDTNPLFDTNMINYLEDIYHFPWYKHVLGRKWGIFFSCGVFRYQLNSLWIDVIILIILYFYLEFFSFSIFEEDNQLKSEPYHDRLLSLVDIEVINKEQYHHFIKSMMMSYDITIKEDPQKSFKFDDDDDDNASLPEYKYPIKGKDIKRKEKNKKRIFYKFFKHYLYLSFHYVVLLSILLLLSMNSGLISFGYIFFSMFYLYKSYSVILELEWTLKRGLKYFLKPYLFLDLTLQCVFQIPLDYFKLQNDSFEDFLSFLGLQRLANYNYKEQFINTNGLLIVLSKVFMFFLIHIQEMIYDSNDFKKFILKYHLKYYQKGFANGRLHSFLFNNNRIKLMRNRLEERDEINDSLTKLHSQLVHWNKSVALTYKGKNSDIFQHLHSFRSKKKESRSSLIKSDAVVNKKLSIESILKKQWLISFALSCNELQFSINNLQMDNNKQIKQILRGEVSVKCDLVRAIELYNQEKQPLMSYEFMMSYINRKDKNALKKKKGNINKEEEEEEKEEEKDKDKDSDQDETIIDNDNEEMDSLTNQKKYSEILTDEFFFSSADYYDFKENIRNEFFLLYFSKGKILLFILKSLFTSFINNFANVVYFLMVLNNFMNRSLITIIYPLFVFIIGIIEYPRVNKLYWKISIIHCLIVIFIKFVFQLNLLKITPIFDDFLQNDTWLNIKQCPSAKCSDFFSYVIVDFLLLISLLIHQFMLVRKGLWNYNEIDYETVEEAQERIIQSNSICQRAKDSRHNHETNNQIISNDIFKLVGTVNNRQGSIAGKQKFKQFFNRNFPSVRNEKPGKDYYAYYTIFQMLIIIYIIFFYTNMDQDKLIDNPDSFIVKQFSGDSIICALIQLCLIVLDRFLYLKNARALKKIGFKVYDNQTGADVTEEFNIDDYEEAKRKCDESNNQYTIACFQFEGPKRGLVIKFVMQIINVLAVHYFVFWFLPYKGKKNSSDLNNTVNSNPFILIFYIMYCFYFLFSGLQLKYGMADMRKLPTLMKGSSIVSSCIFKVYRAIPFLQELKAFIDWTFTVTALDIFKWLKFEETFALLYISKCYQKSYFGRRVGSRVTKCMKRLIGVSSTFVLLFLLFGPLFLFSNLNPINLVNQVNGAFLQVTLGITEDNSIKRNFTLIVSRNALSIVKINQQDFAYLSKQHSIEMKNYQIEQIQNISMMGYSEENWNINLKALKYIHDSIQDQTTEEQKLTFEIIIQYSFSSQLDATQSNYNGFQTLKVNNTFLQPFFADDIISCTTKSVNQQLDNFEPNIRVPSQSTPKPLFHSIKRAKIDLYLHCENNLFFWTIKNSEEEDKMKLTIYTDKFSSATAGYDVLTFYLTFILVVGQFLRALFAGEAERVIITEMVDPSPLINVCQGIRISRIRKDFLKEDKLYYILIDLMRSPEILKTITKSSLNYTSAYNIVKEMDSKDKVIESVAIKKPFTSTYRKAFD